MGYTNMDKGQRLKDFTQKSMRIFVIPSSNLNLKACATKKHN